MSELKYNEPAERFAPIVEKSLYAGATVAMVPTENGCWVHYANYCERIEQIKSEADKVIADLEESHKMEVEQLLMEIVELKDKFNEAQTELELWRDGCIISEVHQKELDEKRHANYKRCLAMARWCESEDKRLEAVSPIFETDKECWEYNSDYWDKWHKRWLKIAEQFKEAK